MNIKEGQIYTHAKSGNMYRIIALVKHSETLEDMVVYEAQYENPVSKRWVRPLFMFTELVTVNGEQKPRFELTHDA